MSFPYFLIYLIPYSLTHIPSPLCPVLPTPSPRPCRALTKPGDHVHAGGIFRGQFHSMLVICRSAFPFEPSTAYVQYVGHHGPGPCIPLTASTCLFSPGLVSD